MDDADRPKPPLPGNHGQFGENHATEAYQPLQDHPAPASAPAAAPAPAPAEDASQAPKQTNAGERS